MKMKYYKQNFLLINGKQDKIESKRGSMYVVYIYVTLTSIIVSI